MMKLHGYWRSSCTYRVRIALNLKELPVTIVPVHLLEGAQREETFTEVNPSAQVPVLEVEHEGTRVALAQSMAILEYLEEQHPEPALLPHDPILRARTRQLAEIVNAGIQPLQNLLVMQKLQREHSVDAQAWCAFHIRRGLSAYQAVAQTTAGAFSVGDRPTIADCLLVPQLYNARRFDIDVAAELPLLARIDERCAELEAFSAAHPDRQPDAAP